MYSKGSLPKGVYLPLAIAALIGMVALLDAIGVIEIHGLLNKQIQGNLDNTKPNLEGYKCPKTASDMVKGCGYSFGPNGPIVDTVTVPDKCLCPYGTEDLQVPINAPGGSVWKQCRCLGYG